MKRTIEIENILVGKGSVKGFDGKIAIHLDFGNLSDDALEDFVQRKVFKLACDNARSKYVYTKNQDEQALASIKAGHWVIDAAALDERKRVAKVDLEDLTPEEIVVYLKGKLSAGKLAEVNAILEAD